MNRPNPEKWRDPRTDAKEPELTKASAALRQRDRFGNLSALLIASLLCGVLVFLGVLSLLLPKPEVSEFENRRLKQKPEFSFQALASGRYTQELEAYYSDTFPFRESFVRAAGHIQEYYGPRVGDIRIHNAVNPALEDAASGSSEPAGNAAGPDGPGTDKAPAEPGGPPPEPPTVQDDGTGGEKVGGVFVYKGQALMLFSANDSASRRYAQILNDYHAALGDAVQIYSLVVPVSTEFALPDRLKNVSGPQKPNLDYIASLLDPAVKPVDAYTKLQYHSDEYIYFRSDHHWTGLGAYYAYQAFCEAAGMESVPLESLEKRTLNNFVGSLYSQTQDTSLLKNPDYVDYWLIPGVREVTQYRRGSPFHGSPSTLLGEYAKGSNSYSVFLHGDYPLTKVVTGNKNGRKIAVIKESYGNAFAPFLALNYEEVYVIDQRYFQLGLNSFLKENGIGELLFINNIFAANTSIRINEIQRLMNQVYVPYVPPAVDEEESSSSAPSSSPEKKSHKVVREEESASSSSSSRRSNKVQREDD